MKRKIILSVVLSSLFLMSFTSFHSLTQGITNSADIGVKVENINRTVFDNNSNTLSVNSSNGEFSILDKKSNVVWRSNPLNYKEDSGAIGANKTLLGSQMEITVINANGKLERINSLAGCLNAGGLSLFQNKDKFTFVYHFKKAEIEVPLQISLSDNQLLVSVPQSLIKENGKAKLLEISVLPFFGAGDGKEKGFVLAPDGSGSIINFNNNKAAAGDLEVPVYYGDGDFTSYKTGNLFALIPYFGISKSDEANNPLGAMLCFAESGAAGAKVSAISSGNYTSYNTAKFIFSYRAYSTVTTLDRTWAASNYIKVSDIANNSEDFTLSYSFFSKADANLAIMAHTLREKLGLTNKINNQKYPLFIDAYAGVDVNKQFLGFVYKAIEPLTTVKQLDAVLSDLNTNGIESANVSYNGITENGAEYGKINNKIGIAASVGTMKEMKSLAKKYEGFNLFPQMELMKFNKSSDGANTFFDVSLGSDQKIIKHYTYKLSTNEKNSNVPPNYLLKPSLIEKNAKALAKSSKEHGVFVSLSSVVQMPFTSIGGEKKGINATVSSLKQALEHLSIDTKLMGQAPSAFALKYLAAVNCLPTKSQNFAVSDYSVPFIQMILHGSVPYSTLPINLSGAYDKMVLEAIHSGSSLSFAITFADFDKYSGTSLNYLYGGNYNSQKQDIIEMYKKAYEPLSLVSGKKVIDYKIVNKDVRATTYENGVQIVVNFGQTEVNFNGQKIPSDHYIVIKG